MKLYRKVATGASLGTRARLYRGSDHLLLVEGSVVEEYRRFFYQDIQAAIWMPNRVYAWAVGFFGTVMLLGGMGLLNSLVPEPGWVLTGCGVAVWLRLITVLKGGGYCTFYLHTAAQYTKIPGIATVRKARKLVELIETMTPEERVAGSGVEGTGAGE